MNVVRIEFISKGFQQILKSDGTRDLVTDTAERIASEATSNIGEESEGYGTDTVLSGTRYIAFASSKDKTAAIAESENKALSRALHE